MPHDNPQVQAVSRPVSNRYLRSGVSGNAAAAQDDDAWLRSAIEATTVGELYELWKRATEAGAATETLRVVCGAVKERLGPDGHWAAIALVKRELGAELVS